MDLQGDHPLFLIVLKGINCSTIKKSGNSTQMDTKSQSYCWDRSPLDKNVSDYRFRVVTIKNLLSSSKLDTTTKPSPRACGKNRVRNSFPLVGKPDDLFKDGFTFPI